MTKSQLAAHIAEAAGITKKQAAAAIDAFSSGVLSALRSSDGRVSISGFGSFAVRERAATKARTMMKPGVPGETVRVAAKPATRVAKWRPAATFKEAVAKKGRG